MKAEKEKPTSQRDAKLSLCSRHISNGLSWDQTSAFGVKNLVDNHLRHCTKYHWRLRMKVEKTQQIPFAFAFKLLFNFLKWTLYSNPFVFVWLQRHQQVYEFVCCSCCSLETPQTVVWCTTSWSSWTGRCLLATRRTTSACTLASTRATLLSALHTIRSSGWQHQSGRFSTKLSISCYSSKYIASRNLYWHIDIIIEFGQLYSTTVSNWSKPNQKVRNFM